MLHSSRDMKLKQALLICILFVTTSLSAHDYFFAFAEMKYNEVSGRIEATITLTTHDYERSLRERGILNQEISKLADDEEAYAIFQADLNKGFKLNVNGKEIQFNLEGIEVQLTGVTNFHLSAEVPSSITKLEMTFDLLMESFVEQQNKITFIYRNNKSSYEFLQNKITQEIILSNE